VVSLSVLAALTLLPALLGLLGPRLQQAQLRQLTWKPQTVWTVIAQTITRHSVTAIFAVLVLVAGLTSPFLSARFGLPTMDILPQASLAREGGRVLQHSFGAGETTPILVELRTLDPEANILSEPYLSRLYQLVAQLQRDPRVAQIKSLVNLKPQLTLANYRQLYRQPELSPDPQLTAAIRQLSNQSITLVTIKSDTVSNDPRSRSLVQDLRDLKVEGLKLQVAGQTAAELDTVSLIYQRSPLVLAALMTATYVLLCMLLHSILLPLKAILMNLLSIGASFGALVFIFQQGHFQTWLDFRSVGYLDLLLPVVLFYVLFGVSMDYEVFLLSRIKEAYDQTGDNSRSIIAGLEQTGGIITSAALILIVVTSAFVFTSIIFVKALGLGCAIAILIDATLIRVILVPATMQLMNRWNWWFPD